MDYSELRWSWFIEQGVVSELDERTGAGDDHPARLYLKFADPNGEERSMEIIWGNRHLQAGEWLKLKFFGLYEYPHYVANAGAENEGRWFDESVDLRLRYEELWGDSSGVHLIDVALFCDTDQTGSESVAYFSEVRLDRAKLGP